MQNSGFTFFKVKHKACICLGHLCGVVGGQGTTLLQCTSMTSFSGCSWGHRSVVGMPKYGNQGLHSLFSGKYTPTHSVGSTNPSYPHAFICSPCSPVQWDSGCRVTQLFLATSITDMCALRAVFYCSNCCTWPWAESVCPPATIDQQSWPAVFE